MSTTEKFVLGSIATLASTELNSLANTSLAAGSSPFNNIQGGGGGDGYTLCDLELVVSFGSAPTSGSAVSTWFLARPDGTNFEDGSSSVTPARLPDATFPLRAVTGAQRIVRRIMLPWGVSSPLIKNDGTGVAFASSGNTLKALPVSPQGV